jgi:drug/metabolite transporter (DMT)-like permease
VAERAKRVRSAVTVAVLFMLLSALLSSALHVGVRYMSSRLPVFEIVFLRTFLSMLVTLPLVLRPGQMAWRSNAPSLHVLRGLVGTASMAAWYYSLSVLPLADATTFGMTTTLFVVLGAAFWFRERVDAGRWCALAVGFLGCVIVLRPTGAGVALVPALIAISSSALWAMSLLLAKNQARYDSSLTITFYQPLTITPLAALGAYFVWVTPTWHDLGVLSGMAVLASIGNYCSIQALRMADASITMPVDYTKLLWTVIAGYLLFSEVPGLSTWAGAALIVGASLYIAIRESRRPVVVPAEAGVLVVTRVEST